MFGHQNDTITQDQQTDADVSLPDEAIDDLAEAPLETPAQDDQSSPDLPSLDPPTETPFQPTTLPAEPPSTPLSSTDNFLNQAAPIITPTVQPANHPVGSSDNDSSSSVPDMPAPQFDSPTQPDEDDTAAAQDTTTPEDDSHQPIVQNAANDDLLSIKQEALESLSPLVDKLEQAPDEKFDTLMMLIRASDNHSLISAAHEAAKQISDEKTRAQALLDVVNEINYFTHGKADKAA